MKDYQIIDNPLDQDMYKFSMMQGFLHQFPSVITEWKFVNRGLPPLGFLAEPLKEQVKALCDLYFTWNQLEILYRRMPYLSSDFLDFLHFFKLNYDHVIIKNIDGQLDVRIDGPAYQVTLFEVQILAIISELYTLSEDRGDIEGEFENRTIYKLRDLSKSAPTNFRFADFGTRRRMSKYSQRFVVREAIDVVPNLIVGTSNVMMAEQFNTKAIGTQAHEWFMMMQALVRLADSQKFGLDAWAKEYRGELGIALTDTIGIDAFLRDFDKYYAKLYDGLRHDSGDPYSFANKVINHYEKLGIRLDTKTIVFSDSLNFDKALKLTQEFSDTINVSHGIGTFLTHDTLFKPLNMVMKIVRVNGKPVAKISDSGGKTICEDPSFVEYLKEQFSEGI